MTFDHRKHRSLKTFISDFFLSFLLSLVDGAWGWGGGRLSLVCRMSLPVVWPGAGWHRSSASVSSLFYSFIFIFSIYFSSCPGDPLLSLPICVSTSIDLFIYLILHLSFRHLYLWKPYPRRLTFFLSLHTHIICIFFLVVNYCTIKIQKINNSK